MDAAERAERVLGVDVGERRIGLALSDELGYTAQPLFTLYRAPGRNGLRDDLKSIARVLRKHAPVREAVVGNPLYMSGDQSPQAARAQAFADTLRTELGLTVHLWDERLTTTEAHRHLDALGHSRAPNAEGVGRKNIIDQVAAVLILQAFLEARANARQRGEIYSQRNVCEPPKPNQPACLPASDGLRQKRQES